MAAAGATSRSSSERTSWDRRRVCKARAAGTPPQSRGLAVGQLSASLPARALTCISLSLLAFSLPRGPLALPAGGEPCSRFLRGGLQMCRLLEQLGLSYPG